MSEQKQTDRLLAELFSWVMLVWIFYGHYVGSFLCWLFSKHQGPQ
jgi:hypothetical protein